jgi:microcystin-dependent protein
MSLISVPLKVILPWHADLQNDTPPTDYAICDGRTLNSSQQDINPGSTYTVPDLRNAFLIGADLTKTAGTAGVAVGNGNINAGAGAPGPKGVGGENQHTTTTTEMPGHNHPLTSTPGDSAKSGIAGIGVRTSPMNNTSYGPGPADNYYEVGYPITMVNTGGGGAHENRPKYYGVVYIMKVKI